MKSILVDAIREASGSKPDSALSDSGSFDASSQEFGATANDEHVVGDGELELMATTNSLELPSEQQENSAESNQAEETASADEIDTSHAVTIVGELPRPVPPQKAPALARFAPHICVLLAIAVSAFWMLAHQLGVGPSVNGIDSDGRSARLANAPGDPQVGAEVAPNFPFLEIEQPFDEREMQ